MKLTRDPLIHFLVFGVLLFIAHGLWTTHVTKSDRRLVVDTREIARQSDLFSIENGRRPTDAELQGIIVSYVEEEVLAREAEALGLGEDDTVIRRRLAQKMRLLTDSGPIADPGDEVLRDWWAERRADYGLPERRLLQHIYFSNIDRADARADALRADLTDWESQGDPFIVAREFGPVTLTRTAQDYGPDFAREAFDMALNVWTDPVQSPFGIHRIRAIQILPAVDPDFPDVRDRVLSDWMDEARKERAAQTLRDRVAKYDVVIEEPEQP